MGSMASVVELLSWSTEIRELVHDVHSKECFFFFPWQTLKRCSHYWGEGKPCVLRSWGLYCATENMSWKNVEAEMGIKEKKIDSWCLFEEHSPTLTEVTGNLSSSFMWVGLGPGNGTTAAWSWSWPCAITLQVRDGAAAKLSRVTRITTNQTARLFTFLFENLEDEWMESYSSIVRLSHGG